jgi:hypothetical protein
LQLRALINDSIDNNFTQAEKKKPDSRIVFGQYQELSDKLTGITSEKEHGFLLMLHKAEQINDMIRQYHKSSELSESAENNNLQNEALNENNNEIEDEDMFKILLN